MNEKDLNDLGNKILNLEKKRINNANWADLTLRELDLIDDLKKRSMYRREINEFHIQVLNTFSTLVPKDFKFSVPNNQLTCRIMATDYMNYFYSKGMTKEEIIQMMANSKIAISGDKQK